MQSGCRQPARGPGSIDNGTPNRELCPPGGRRSSSQNGRHLLRLVRGAGISRIAVRPLLLRRVFAVVLVNYPRGTTMSVSPLPRRRSCGAMGALTVPLLFTHCTL